MKTKLSSFCYFGVCVLAFVLLLCPLAALGQEKAAIQPAKSAAATVQKAQPTTPANIKENLRLLQQRAMELMANGLDVNSVLPPERFVTISEMVEQNRDLDKAARMIDEAFKGLDRLVQEKKDGRENQLAKLDFFYLVHVHVYDDAKTPTKEQFDKLAAPVERLAKVFEAHGLKGTFEVVPHFAEAAVKYQGKDNILTKLEARGHEIAGHAHNFGMIQQSHDSITKAGVKNLTTMAAAAGKLDPRGDNIKEAGRVGFSVFTHNASPTDAFGGATGCTDFGLGNNTMYEETNNIMHPWRPSKNDFCAHDTAGKVLYVDSAIPDWFIPKKSEGPPNYSDTTPDSVNDEKFNTLKPWFNAALKHLDDKQVNVWGIVTHQVQQYTDGLFGTMNDESFAALDRFLDYVDGFVAERKVKYSTVQKIADEFVALGAKRSESDGHSAPDEGKSKSLSE